MLPSNEPVIDTERIETLVQKIDLQNERLVKYGSGVQEKFAKLSDNVLHTIIALDPKEIDELTAEIKSVIEKFNTEDSNDGFFSALRSAKKKEQSQKAKYAETAKILNEKRRKLNGQRMKALVNLSALKRFRELNSEYHEALEYHILAGRQKLGEIREGELAQLRWKVEEAAARPEDIAACNFLQDRTDVLEERICSLETTRTMSSQMTIQLSLTQTANEQLMQKINDGNSLISAWEQNAMLEVRK